MNYCYNPKQRNTQPKKSRFKFFAGLFFFTVIFGGIAGYLVFSSSWQIVRIEIEGCRAVKELSLKEELTKKISRKKWFIFPASSIFLFSNSAKENYLKDLFPRIKEIDIDKDWPDGLEVVIEEKKPAAVWCGSDRIEIVEATTTEENILSLDIDGEESEEKSAVAKSYGEKKKKKKIKYIYTLDKNNCFYIDDEGGAFEQISDIELSLLNKSIIKLQEWRTNKIEIKKDKFSVDFLQYAKDLKEQISSVLSIDADEFIVPNYLIKEIHLVMPQGWKIYFNTDDEISAQIEILRVVLNKKIPASEQAMFDYIDLRVGEKVFYKFK